MELVLFRETLQAGTINHPTSIAKQALVVDATLNRFAEEMPLNGQFQAFWLHGQFPERVAYQGYYHGTSSTML